VKTETFQSQPAIRIEFGKSTALLAPGHGARLLSWSIGDTPIIRWPENADWSRPAKVRGGDPVLFPFIARTFCDGKIGFWRDGAGTVRPAPMHGFARDSAFSITDAGPDFLRVGMESNDTTNACYPFAFRFEVIHRIGPDWLDTSFCVTNKGDRPMPWSAGHHFYFHLPAADRADWELEIPCQNWGSQDFSNGSIHLASPACSKAPVSDPAWIDRFHVQPSIAEIRFAPKSGGPAIRFEDSSPVPGAWDCVTTWTENAGSDFFCVEPWSALPDAIHNGMGLRHLAPGATDEISIRIRAA
jgi:galactose mutarotase-like enzyme